MCPARGTPLRRGWQGPARPGGRGRAGRSPAAGSRRRRASTSGPAPPAASEATATAADEPIRTVRRDTSAAVSGVGTSVRPAGRARAAGGTPDAHQRAPRSARPDRTGRRPEPRPPPRARAAPARHHGHTRCRVPPGDQAGERGDDGDDHRHAAEQHRLVRGAECRLGELGEELRGEPDDRVPDREERRRRGATSAATRCPAPSAAPTASSLSPPRWTGRARAVRRARLRGSRSGVRSRTPRGSDSVQACTGPLATTSVGAAGIVRPGSSDTA